ncbi:protein tyrosine phosphatase [Mycolicibacterium gilvum]|uniref:Protein tyrosine phosphatase n=1 Tax=Mycolicibacterium gilvum TaxID=1804 RepID=A0A378SHG0_9MYCO|nr:protein tyrosine phosphatase [Mycolicibacterium gilvum]
MVGSPIHRDAAIVLTRLGGEPTGFAARQFTTKVASEADLILTMTTAHRDKVLERAPRLLRRTFTISELFWLSSHFEARSIADLWALRPELVANQLVDVVDPIDQSPEIFATVGSQIADLLIPTIEFCQRAAKPTAE